MADRSIPDPGGAYRDTLLVLEREGVSESHGTEPVSAPESGTTKGAENPPAFGNAQIGDMVDVEVNGSLVFPAPVRVRAVSQDRAWAFVDGSETGIEMDNVIVRDRPEGFIEKKAPPTLPLEQTKESGLPPVPVGYRSETFDADEGQILISWPSNLSSQSFEDMTDWLELLKRRIARRAEKGTGGD